MKTFSKKAAQCLGTTECLRQLEKTIIISTGPKNKCFAYGKEHCGNTSNLQRQKTETSQNPFLEKLRNLFLYGRSI